MFSEVCIPLTLGACEHHCCTSEGLVVLRDYTNRVCGVAAIVYRREHGSRQFDRKLDSEDGGERSERGFAMSGLTGDPLARGEGPKLSTELPDRELGPCEELQQGLGGSLHASRYLGKNTGFVDGSLHISTLLFSFRIYIAILVCALLS